MSNKPIATLAELEKQRVWIPEDDRIGFDAIRSLGGAPVQMPMTDVLTGLQTELLDTIITSAVGAVVFQWHGQVRYITNLPLVYLYGALVIDARAFNRLLLADQGVFRGVMEGTHQQLNAQGALEDTEFMTALLQGGIDKLHVNPLQVVAWRAKVQASNRSLAEAGEFSIPMLDELETHLSEYRAKGRLSSNVDGSVK